MSEKKSLKNHWESSYENEESKLGWYQKSAKESLDLISKSGVSKNDKIVDIGSGSSILIDELIHNGYTNIIATDISEKALENTKNRLSDNELKHVSWIIDDLTNPTKLKMLADIAVWHDRAVFHFLTEGEDQQTYFNLLNNAVKSGGHVIIATFNLNGAEKCSRLPVKRYDADGIAKFLGDNYQLIDFFDFDYTNPNGDNRPYVFTLFQKS
tara:strand:+ start:12657 stop:13289 length:633 start_codon:yes stop_codon:yes gene_type:complete